MATFGQLGVENADFVSKMPQSAFFSGVEGYNPDTMEYGLTDSKTHAGFVTFISANEKILFQQTGVDLSIDSKRVLSVEDIEVDRIITLNSKRFRIIRKDSKQGYFVYYLS